MARVTTIVAVQNAEGVRFGADTQVTATRKYTHIHMAKISHRGQYIVAGSGLSSYCDVAQHIWNPPVPTANDKKDIYHFVISKVIPSLKQCFKDNDLKLEGDKDEETRFAFLIAVCGEVFDIGDDFAVSIDAGGLYAIGSGSSLALGALESGKSIKRALEIAAKHDPYTGPPFIYAEQKKG